jgi:hypothetical protein
MTKLFVLIVAITVLWVACSDDDPAEVVSRPDTPQGPIELNPGEAATFRTGGE